MTDEPKSPLTEADPQSLQALFSADPSGFQKQDRKRIVEELRRARANWDAAKAKGKKQGQRLNVKPTMTVDDLKDLKL